MHIIETVLAIIIAYFLGSLTCAIIVCKLMGLPDPRSEGSHNPGATNVMRIGGLFPAALTMFGDIMKGVIPVLLAKWYGLNNVGIALTALAAFLGHLYPIFFRFEGGKGVATLLGVIIPISSQVTLCLLVTWIVLVILTRYVSFASICAVTLGPIYLWYFTNQPAYIILGIVMAVIAIYRHKTNIVALIQGNERRIGKKSS